MKKLYFLIFLLLSLFYFGQFTTPGTGVFYTLTSLSEAAPASLIKNGDVYTMKANITISPEDVLIVREDNVKLIINPNIQLTVGGGFRLVGNNTLITSGDPASPFRGLQFTATSVIMMRNTTLEYGGGIMVSSNDFMMDNCIVRYFKSGLVSSGAMSFSAGVPIVQNSQFIENDLPAFSSGANVTVSARFIGNYLYKNSKTVSKRPQINMGPGGTDSIKIVNNTIIGDRNITTNGGINLSALVGGTNRFRMEGNTIRDNSFGITSSGGGSTGIIKNNILENNNTITDPNSGGSGISLSNTGLILVSGNKIRNNLWGITLIGAAKADLGGGELGSEGNNVFYNNGNGGKIYALYNNTANPVSAINNCWREGELSDDAMVEAVITHKTDVSTLGLVTYSPYLCSATLSTNEISLPKNSIYPNPSNGNFTLDAADTGNFVITDMSGRLVYSGVMQKGKNQISINVMPGLYILVGQTNGNKFSTKLIIK